MKISYITFILLIASSFNSFLYGQTSKIEDQINITLLKFDSLKSFLYSNYSEIIDQDSVNNLFADAENELRGIAIAERIQLGEITSEFENIIKNKDSLTIALIDTVNLLTEQIRLLEISQTDELFREVKLLVDEQLNLSRKIMDLENTNKALREQFELMEDTLVTNTIKINDLNNENSILRITNENLESTLNYYRGNVKIGLSIGYNLYFNNQRDYIVQPDSSVKEIGDGRGASGIVSGVVMLRARDFLDVIVNLPLGDFTNSSEQAIGIFNNRIAVGLGVAWYPIPKTNPNLSIAFITNVSPFEKIDFDSIQNQRFTEPTFTKLDPTDYGSTSDVSLSFTIGISYSFVSTGND